MESNEQTEPTSKIEADSWIESRLIALRQVWGGEIEQKRKRTHGLRPQCSDCWLGRECMEVKEGIREINGNRKKYHKLLKLINKNQ